MVWKGKLAARQQPNVKKMEKRKAEAITMERFEYVKRIKEAMGKKNLSFYNVNHFDWHIGK